MPREAPSNELEAPILDTDPPSEEDIPPPNSLPDSETEEETVESDPPSEEDIPPPNSPDSETEEEIVESDSENEQQPPRRRIRTRGGHVQAAANIPQINLRAAANHQHPAVAPARGIRARRGCRPGGRRGGGIMRRRGRGGRVRAQPANVDTWHWVPDDITEDPADDIRFTEREGLKVRMGNNRDPIDFLNLYLPDRMYELIVRETNRYAEQYMLENPEQADNSYVGTWEDTTVPEMKNFIGIILLMGIVYKPSIKMYWATNELVNTPVFSKLMHRSRFQLLLKFLHYNDNEDPNYDKNSDDRDRLHKLRPFIEIVRQQCKNIFYPGQNLSVDESLVLFKGRLKFKQYIRTKRARFGIKLYELTTSEGITLDFLIYCGKGLYYNDDNNEMPSTERIPVSLMQPYLNKNHVLYTDNWYTSPTLAKYFLDNGTHLCGTVRPNRKHFCKDIVDVPLEKGEGTFYHSTNEPQIMV